MAFGQLETKPQQTRISFELSSHMKIGKKSLSSAQQNFTFTRRTMFIGGVQGALGLVLAGRLGYIAVAENEHYKLKSESNRVNLTLIPPRRGWFIDRNGKPIATNRSDFRVDIIPDRLVDTDGTIQKLAGLLSLPPEEVARIKRDVEKAGGFQPVQIAAGLKWDDYAAVSVRLPELPGVSPRQGYSRYYPTGPAVGHLIGYVGAANAEEYAANKDPLLITPGFKIGKDNLEKRFEKTLSGKPGAKRVEVTAGGKIVRELESKADTPGHSIKLTIDVDLQEYAARRIGLESGSVCVLDCETGDILAMASMPSFDPNSFSDGIGVSEWKWLSGDDHVPLRNKSLSGLYPPGSTVKPMVALALLKAGIKPEDSISCSGAANIAGGKFHCWSRRGHGTVNMGKAIYQSCDIYFYQMALRAGIGPIAEMAKYLGLGEKYDLPVLSQSYGTVPSPEWKQKKYNQAWEKFDTVNATIGQGYMLSNPLQLAVMAARIASGRNVAPHLLFNEKRVKGKPLNIPQEHLDLVRKAMGDVVSGIGTAGKAQLPVEGVKLAGKTGTAQVRRITLAERRGGVKSNSSLNWKFRDHGLFVCFAPVDNPRFACSVVIEHGGGSGAAYPIARDVLTFLYDKEKAMAALQGLEAGWGGPPQARMERDLARWRAVNEVKTPEEAKKEAEESAEEIKRKEAEAKEADAKKQEGGPGKPISQEDAARQDAARTQNRAAEAEVQTDRKPPPRQQSARVNAPEAGPTDANSPSPAVAPGSPAVTRGQDGL